MVELVFLEPFLRSPIAQEPGSSLWCLRTSLVGNFSCRHNDRRSGIILIFNITWFTFKSSVNQFNLETETIWLYFVHIGNNRHFHTQQGQVHHSMKNWQRFFTLTVPKRPPHAPNTIPYYCCISVDYPPQQQRMQRRRCSMMYIMHQLLSIFARRHGKAGEPWIIFLLFITKLLRHRWRPVYMHVCPWPICR